MLRALACSILFVCVCPFYGQQIVMGTSTSNAHEVYCNQEQWDSCYVYLKPIFYSQPEYYFSSYVKVLWNLKKLDELETVCVEMHIFLMKFTLMPTKCVYTILKTLAGVN